MKKLSYIKLYRPELGRLIDVLDERELVVFLALVSKAGWDHRHIDHYSKVNKTFRELQKEFFPRMSVSKVHGVIKTLKSKGFLEKTKKGFQINYVWMYTAPQKTILNALSKLEHPDQIPKQIFHNLEQNVPPGELLNLRKKLNGLSENMRIPRGP